MVTVKEVVFDALDEVGDAASTGKKIYVVLRTGSKGVWSQEVRSKDNPIVKRDTTNSLLCFIDETFALPVSDPEKDRLVIIINHHAHHPGSWHSGATGVYGRVAVALSALMEPNKPIRLDGDTFSVNLSCVVNLSPPLHTESQVRQHGDRTAVERGEKRIQ